MSRIVYKMLFLKDVSLNQGLFMEREGVMTDKRVQQGVSPARWINYSQKRRF